MYAIYMLYIIIIYITSSYCQASTSCCVGRNWWRHFVGNNNKLEPRTHTHLLICYTVNSWIRWKTKKSVRSINHLFSQKLRITRMRDRKRERERELFVVIGSFTFAWSIGVSAS